MSIVYSIVVKAIQLILRKDKMRATFHLRIVDCGKFELHDLSLSPGYLSDAYIRVCCVVRTFGNSYLRYEEIE